MNELMKLYYHEIVKNKNKFTLMTLYLVIFLITLNASIYTRIFGSKLLIKEIPEILETFTENPNFPKNIAKLLDEVVYKGIRFDYIELNQVILLFIILGVILCILASYDIVYRNYRKKNNSYLIDSLLPVKTLYIKLSRILCGISIYLCFIIGMTLILLGSNLILANIYTKLYSGDIYNITHIWKYLLLLNFPESIWFMIFYIFMPMISLQSLTSLFLTDNKRGNYGMKIAFFVTVFLCGIIFAILIFNLQGFMYGYPASSKKILLVNTVITIITLILFIIDCKVSKSRLRGGM